jgi:uncharacterized protein YutE (UPF0331/DUF86 family)
VTKPEQRLWRQALAAMDGCMHRLERSRQRLAPLFPMSAERLPSLSAAEQEAVDAFLKRFEQLVLTLQDQAFKAVALAEGEDLQGRSRRDLSELMERLGAIPSADRFRAIALIRNRLAHLYPEDPARQAANLDAAFSAIDDLLGSARHLRAFAMSRPWGSS